MIIIIIRSLFIISNYFWQPKPLVVAKIYPVLINGICWNRILNTTQSLPEPTKSTSLFTPDSCFNIKINILSGNINSRSKLENMYSSVRPTTRVSARLPILFGKNASVSSLGQDWWRNIRSCKMGGRALRLILSQISIRRRDRGQGSCLSSRVFCLSHLLMPRLWRVMTDRKSHE